MPTDMLEKANRFIGHDEELRSACIEIPISINWMAGKLNAFASERVAEAVAEERRKIADDLRSLKQTTSDYRGFCETLDRYIEKLRGE